MKNTVSLIVMMLTLKLCSGSGVWPLPPKYVCPERTLHPCKCLAGSDEGIDIVCDNTNLASMAVGLSQLNTKLLSLTISNCNVERLYGDVFRNLDVQKIIIKDTPLVEISNDTFLQVGLNIVHLEILNSRLEVFPAGAIQYLPELQVLIIDSSDLSSIPANSFLGLSKLETIQLSNSRIQTPDKSSFAGQRGLKFLRLYNNNITDVEKGTYDFGTSLELLDLAHNRLSVLDPAYFTPLRKLTWLNLTDNGIETFNSRMFSRNQLLAVLHLGSNNITRLDSSSVKGMRYLRRLYLEDNQIASIGRQAFNNLRVSGIYLSGNQLTEIPYQIFDGLTYVDTLDVSRNQIKKVSTSSFGGLYQAIVNMSHNQIGELVDGTFTECRNFSLDLSYNNLTNIQQEAFDEVSYTFLLNISHNALTNMSQVPMKYQSGITVLDLSYNLIQEIPRNSFPKLYELHTISFRHNQLTDIFRAVFSPLFSIRYLDFSYNKLEQIESSTFGKLPTVLELDLSHNNLTSIKRGGLSGLQSLRTLYLDYNLLDEIPSPPISLNHLHISHNQIVDIKGKQSWPVMNSLISLNLDNNLIGDNLEGGKFDNLNSLQYLSLKYNNISKPPKEALASLRSLRVLNMDGNAIETLEKAAFGKIPALGVLSLSENNLKNISVQAFDGMLQIQNLTLRENNLTYISPGAFLGLVSLGMLDLSHNKLVKLENKTHGLLEDCLSLRKIDLSFNNIAFITPLMFPEKKWVPYKLQEIDLSFNTIPVLTSGILHGTKHLTFLNLSNNIINDIRVNVLGNLSSLEVLDLSYNELQDEKLRADRWGGILKNLTYLSLAYNSLYNIPAAHLAQFESLKTLDVEGNDLIHYFPVFSAPIKAGLDVRYRGNLLRCECSLRPLIQWIRKGNRKTSWDDAICSSPAYLAGKPVSSIREEQLVCDNISEADDYEITPDVKFRNVDEKPSSLALSWFVNTNEDVADFRLELTSLKKNKRTLLVKDIGYNTRYDVLDQVPSGEELRMCLLVKTSLGMIRRWRKDQQCQM
ncbi:chaoptin [Eurytemora carolleeae]|uniref:chaoptin n=1 Tax=Eurytemora carolleeae TaxID=1294199 RepID=UPI000C78D1B7|nr:chaoptin [Eurytemora carolleeae]|eukprot:XP_023321247.1 chaoptin-like [Eurytemora affinis]